MHKVLWAAAIAGLLAASAGATDLTVGGDARAFAMGGAGIATEATAGGPSRNNVASLAFNKGVGNVYLPNIGIRSQGAVRQQDGLDYLLGFGSLGDAAKLIRDFGRSESSFSLNVSGGLRIGHIEALTNAVGVGRVVPGSNGSADVFVEGVYNLPSVGAATVLPNQEGRFQLAVGGRVKYANIVYSHLVVDASGQATPAPEMNGRESRTRQGVAADIGFLLQERNGGPLSVGLTVSNAIKPRGFATSSGQDVLRTAASLGVGYASKKAVFAADLVDITGKSQFRAGAEVFAGRLPVRAGYSSQTGFTYGTRLLGLDVAFSKRQPLEIGRTIRF